MNNKVYIHRLGDWYNLYMNKENEAELLSFAEVVSEDSRKEPMSEDQLLSRMEGARVILSLNGVGASEITNDVLRRLGTVELIVISHWWGQFDDTEAETGIRVIEGSNANTVAVAEWTLAAALMGVRKMNMFDFRLKSGSPWGEPRRTVGMLAESTVGLVGLGRIGRYVARYMRFLGARVIVCDKVATEIDAQELGVTLCRLEDVFSVSDIISLHLPEIPSTLGLIGSKQFGLIKDGAVFINSSRAGVYDERALVEELKSGRFEAYIDVFSTEPIPTDHPLRTMKNVLITPHVAGDNIAMFRRCGREAIESIRKYFDTGATENRKHIFP